MLSVAVESKAFRATRVEASVISECGGGGGGERREKKKESCMSCVTTQSQVPLPLIFLSCYTFTVLPALSALRQTHARSNSNASTVKPMAFALFHTLAPTSGIISPKTSGTLLLSFPSKAS